MDGSWSRGASAAARTRLPAVAACPAGSDVNAGTPGEPRDPSRADRRSANTMLAVRYVLPAVIALVGVIVLIFNRSINGLEGFAMGIGVAGSILLLNVLYRVGVSGDRERDEEEAARVYFDEHGRWPDE